MKRVAILTPSYDCTVDAYFHHSVIDTVKACVGHGIDVVPLTWPGEALVQHGRNALVKLGLSAPDISDFFWIDADQEWTPQQFLAILGHPVDVVGGTYRKRTDEKEEYTVRAGVLKQDANGLCEVDGLGCGFLKVSRKALEAAYNAAESYENNGQQWKMVFDVRVMSGRLWGEDTIFCLKLAGLGFPVYLDPAVTVGHNGYKRYRGDFIAYIGRTHAERRPADPVPDQGSVRNGTDQPASAGHHA